MVWTAVDILIHGVILKSTYAASPEMWRPHDQINLTLTFTITLVVAVAFTTIYARLITPRSIARGIEFGLLFGIAGGFSTAFSLYVAMPVPLHLAAVWFAAILVQATIGGAIIGWIITTQD